MATKSDEYQHLIQEQIAEIDYCPNDSPSWPEAIALGFQHYVTVIGATVLIPSMLVYRMGGDHRDTIRVIQTSLFVNGLNTLLQTFFGSRLPVIMRGSFAFLIPIMSIIYSSKIQVIYDDHERFLRTMREVQGALIVASSVQIILGFGGIWTIVLKFLTPLTLAPVIALAGIGLYSYGFPGVAKCAEVGIPELFLLIIFSQFLKRWKARKVPLVERFPVILSTVIIWLYAHILTISGAYRHTSFKTRIRCRTDQAHLIDAAPWVRIPYPLEWGAPTFNVGHAFAMTAAAMVAQVESTAAFYGISRIANATPPPIFIMGRGIGWQGIGTLLDGLFGTLTGSTVSIENAGLVGLTRVGSRRTVQIAAVFMIFSSIFGKFGGLIASIPQPIFAAMFCVLDGFFAAGGLSLLQFTNLNLPRNLFILGFTFFMGISIPDYFLNFQLTTGHGPVHTAASWFNDMLNAIFSSHVVVGFIIALLLDNAIRDGASEKDRGLTWWRRYHKWKDCPTNEEFYKLPFNLNKYFPPPQI